MTEVALASDTLCWHARLEAGATTLERVLETTAKLGLGLCAVNLHHVRSRDLSQLAALTGHGVRLLASGDFVGAARHGERVADGVARVRGWIERAAALSSPTLRLASGFYRAELHGRDDLIDAERAYVTAVLQGAGADAEAASVRLLLENHSDFSAAEYTRIIDDTHGSVGVFLDVINPIAAFDDPLATVAALAPLAPCGHVKDFRLVSIQQPDAYHRRGFEVRYCYPGEGQADLPSLVRTLAAHTGDAFVLAIEGLDNHAGVDDQERRLAASIDHLRAIEGVPWA